MTADGGKNNQRLYADLLRYSLLLAIDIVESVAGIEMARFSTMGTRGRR